MKSLVQRILFYFRYEMTDDVRMRAELASIACVMFVVIGVMGHRIHTLHRMQQETEAELAAISERIRALYPQTSKRKYRHPMGHLRFRFREPGEAPKRISSVKTED